MTKQFVFALYSQKPKQKTWWFFFITFSRLPLYDLLLAFSYLKSGDGAHSGCMDRFFKLLLSYFSIEKRYLFLFFLKFGITTRAALGESEPRFSISVVFLSKESGILYVLYRQFQNRDHQSSPINSRDPP